MGYYREQWVSSLPAFFMPRRPAVLLTSPRSIPASSLFRTFCTLLQKSKAHPLTFQPLPASSQKRQVCLPAEEGRHHRFSLFNFSTLHFALTLTPSESALTQTTSLNPLESALAKNSSRKSFRIRTYEKNRGVGCIMLTISLTRNLCHTRPNPLLPSPPRLPLPPFPRAIIFAPRHPASPVPLRRSK
jgi:hypothetical protein